MSALTTESLATRLRQVRLERRADKAPKLPATWDVVKVALTVPTIAWLVAAALVFITKVAAGAGFSGMGVATSAGWLAMNQTALTVGGVTIGVLPLLPTLLLAYGTYRVVRRAVRRSGSFNELLQVAGTAVIGPLLATALALAVIADGASSVSPVGNPDALAAFGMTLLVHGVAAVVGLLGRALPAVLEEFALPAADRVGVRGGAAAFATMVVGGAVLVFVGFLTHFSVIGDVIAEGNTFDGHLGLTVLSVLYLPNFVVGAAAVSAGANATLGGTVIDAFGVNAGALPPVPVAAIVPSSDLGWWGALLFVVPVAAGVLLGWYTRSDVVMAHLRAIVVGAAVASLLMVVAVGLSGGQLGEMGSVEVGAPVAGVFTFAAVGVPAALVAGIVWLTGRVSDRAAAEGDFDEILDEDDEADAFEDQDSDVGSDVDAEPAGEDDTDLDAGTEAEGDAEAEDDADADSEADAEADAADSDAAADRV